MRESHDSIEIHTLSVCGAIEIVCVCVCKEKGRAVSVTTCLHA